MNAPILANIYEVIKKGKRLLRKGKMHNRIEVAWPFNRVKAEVKRKSNLVGASGRANIIGGYEWRCSSRS
jgi:hypothetical protein